MKQSIKSRKHRVPGRINPMRNIPRYIAIKITKIKDKEKILKGQGKLTNNLQGYSHKVII